MTKSIGQDSFDQDSSFVYLQQRSKGLVHACILKRSVVFRNLTVDQMAARVGGMVDAPPFSFRLRL